MRKIPHTYVIVFYILLISAIMTWIIPGGEYVEKTVYLDGVEKTELVYRQVDKNPQSWQVFSALFKGFVKQSGIIVFILMIGGAFWIMNSSKAIDAGILSFIRFSRRLEQLSWIRRLGADNIIITLVMILFSVFGAVFGMSEETIAFVIIMVPLAISMGYDSIVGVCLCFVAAGLGFAGAILNPFTIGIAQGIAGLPLFSGLEYRIICWVSINFVGIGYVLRYARKIKAYPEKSPVYQEDGYWRKKDRSEWESIAGYTPVSAWFSYGIILTGLIAFSIFNHQTTFVMGDPDTGTGSSLILPMIPAASGLFALAGWFSLRKSVQFFQLTLLGFTILFLIIGVMGYQWYIMKIAALFFAMGFFSGMAMNYSPNRITGLFLEGVRDILPAALIVGLAGGIIVILEDGKIVDSILYSLSGGMDGLGKMASVGIMYCIQTLINVFIPSGSAQAALTMPIMAPFSDLIGISRQAAVMVYQFGDGFTNMITPTSGVLIGVLGVARIPYEKWIKWVTPFMIILMILGFLLLIPTVTVSLNGF
ncbi:MAG: short-chain fatty acid transporter [Bacteroides sp. SM23_62]|nr:MAG: short-chain fatty acid transporter [Bacteroides sp. SM23_62]